MKSAEMVTGSSSRWAKSAPLGFCAVVLLTVVLYLPSLAGGFVWDDTALVLRDPLIRSWRLTNNAFDHFLFLDATASNFYRPLQRLSYISDYQWFGFTPWGYHLTSVLTHALAAGALFLVARAMMSRFSPVGTDPTWPSLATATVWAIHPLQTSAVTYVSGRADPLAALFCFLGLAMGLRALGNPLVNWREFVAGLCFLLAAFSKEMGLIGFGLWLVTLVAARAPARRVITAFVISGVAIGTYATLRTGAQHLDPPAAAPSTMSERPGLAAAALGEYAGLVVAPAVLRMERGQQRWPSQEAHDTTFKRPSATACTAGAGVALVFVLWLTHALRHRRQTQALALILAALCYLPVSNLITLNATVAEHWLYLPLAFVLLTASLDLTQLLAGWRARRSAWANVIVACLVFWGGFLAVRTWIRQGDWIDQSTFLARTIADGGDTPRMYINRGHEFVRKGDRAAGRADFERALALAPGQPFASLGLASLDYGEGKFDAARKHLEVVSSQEYYRPAALELLALIRRKENSGDGLAELKRALDLTPDDWPLTRRKIRFLVADGKPAPAIKLLRGFINEQPFRAESWLLLAGLLQENGNPEAARVATQLAAQRDVHLDEGPK